MTDMLTTTSIPACQGPEEYIGRVEKALGHRHQQQGLCRQFAKAMTDVRDDEGVSAAHRIVVWHVSEAALQPNQQRYSSSGKVS